MTENVSFFLGLHYYASVLVEAEGGIVKIVNYDKFDWAICDMTFIKLLSQFLSQKLRFGGA